MQYRKLGNSDLKASTIGLGTGQFGSKVWGYGLRYSDDNLLKVVQAAIASGINLFDTAETYGDGFSETLLGRALGQYDRGDFLIVTKVAPWNLRRNSLIKAADRSLRRLGMDAIDLYLVHCPNRFVPIKETFRTLEHLVNLGKIRYIGVSNFPSSLMRKAQEILSRHEVVANEIEYNILSRRAEKETIPYCKQQKIGIIAYSPLAGGVLTGRFSANRPARDRARAFNFLGRRSFLTRAQPLFAALGKLAEEKRVSMSQLSLGYIIRDGSIYAIPAALTEKEVRENAEASEIKLSTEELSTINKAAVTLSTSTYLFDQLAIRPIAWAKETIRRLAFPNHENCLVKRL